MTTALQHRHQNITDLKESTVYPLMGKLKDLRTSSVSTKEQFVELHQKFVTWIDGCDQENDPLGAGAAVSLVFAVLEHSQNRLSNEEKKELGQRAAAVIRQRLPIDGIRDEFLKQYE
ncbi:MAG: hypothetical protein JSS30_04825 [Verrucomicrobia bacterium]|nr:hypothetical protein [Verrucomicrobiota bacterium]